MEEQFDIYDTCGNPLGSKARSLVHHDGDWHCSFHLWLVRPSERALLLQRRAEDKDTYPGFFDVSVGGHLRAGESFTDALREVEEELGVVIPASAMTMLGVIPVVKYPVGAVDCEFCLVALASDERPLDEYVFDQGELAGIASLPIGGLAAALHGKNAPIRYFDGQVTTERHLDPSTLNPQPYLPDLFACCLDYLAGERRLSLPGALPWALD